MRGVPLLRKRASYYRVVIESCVLCLKLRSTQPRMRTRHYTLLSALMSHWQSSKFAALSNAQLYIYSVVAGGAVCNRMSNVKQSLTHQQLLRIR